MNQTELRLYAEKVAQLEQVQRTSGEQLREANDRLAQSEERFRDLFEEAPIAYLIGGFDSRFIRANRTATRILGIKPEEVAGMNTRVFSPDTPEAQRRLREALKSVGHGIDASELVLELRRKDDGRPLWCGRGWKRAENIRAPCSSTLPTRSEAT
jgi:formate hydrogenlyase transcriptional activator